MVVGDLGLRGHRDRHDHQAGRRIATLDPPLDGTVGRRPRDVHARHEGARVGRGRRGATVQTLVRLSDCPDGRGRPLRRRRSASCAWLSADFAELEQALVAARRGLDRSADHGLGGGARRPDRGGVDGASARARLRQPGAVVGVLRRGRVAPARGAGSSTGPGSWRPAERSRSGCRPPWRPPRSGGGEDLWIRARLVGGDYGRPKYVVTSTTVGTTVTQSTSIETSDLHPPEIESIEARFVLDGETAPEGVLVVDNLADTRPDRGQRCRPGALPLVRGRPRRSTPESTALRSTSV